MPPKIDVYPQNFFRGFRRNSLPDSIGQSIARARASSQVQTPSGARPPVLVYCVVASGASLVQLPAGHARPCRLRRIRLGARP